MVYLRILHHTLSVWFNFLPRKKNKLLICTFFFICHYFHPLLSQVPQNLDLSIKVKSEQIWLPEVTDSNMPIFYCARTPGPDTCLLKDLNSYFTIKKVMKR